MDLSLWLQEKYQRICCIKSSKDGGKPIDGQSSSEQTISKILSILNMTLSGISLITKV
jgi:hypothetical protein